MILANLTTPTNLADALAALSIFEIALAAIVWARKGTPEEDKMVADCHDFNLQGACNADATGVVDCMTHKNWRDQLTVEQALELARERDLRRMPDRN